MPTLTFDADADAARAAEGAAAPGVMGEMGEMGEMGADTLDAAPTVARLDRHFAQTVVTLRSGAQVALRQAGDADGPAVVLLHGIGSGAASWLQVATRLAALSPTRVIAWDAPGYGVSTPLEMPAPTAPDYAARLHEALSALRINRCVLVGHSLGALMAAAYAAGPGLAIVQRVLWISPACGYGTPERKAAGALALQSRLGQLQAHGVDGMARAAPARLLSAQAGAECRAWVQWNAARLDPAGYTQAVRMLCSDAIEHYRPLAMPADVLVGDADAVTPPDTCQAVAGAFGTRCSLIGGAGHASPIERPADVAKAVAQSVAQSVSKTEPQPAAQALAATPALESATRHG